MRLPLRYIAITILAALIAWQEGYAQEVEDVEVLDYRDFKFYSEEEDDDISLWGGLNTESEEETTRHYAPNSRYALSYATTTFRGFRYSEARNMLGYMIVDYATTRLLRNLGYKTSTSYGIGTQSGALGETTTILSGEESRLYDHHSLRVDLSGRNYLIGANYRGIYSLNTNGVALKEGWQLLSNARVRTGRDLYVDGVYTNGLDLSFGASYTTRNDNLDLIIALPLSERGLRQASTEEAFTLTQNRLYNPAWGMQSGKVRNSRVATSLRPEAVAVWQRRVTATTDMTLSANIYYDLSGTSALTWFNAPTPAPDNYKYMPSYHNSDSDRKAVEEAWRGNDLHYTQIDWEHLYHTNAIQGDGHARYAVASRHTNTSHAAINLGFSSRLNGATMQYGVELRNDTERAFRVMDDLLGATHIIDKDYYLEDDATYSHLTENDLRNPVHRVTEGERYGYDYALTRRSAKLYATAQWQTGNIDLSVAANIALDQTLRRGYFEKELYSGSASYGRSQAITLTPAMLLASAHYTLGKHDMGISLLLRGESPHPDDLFLQPEYNNRRIDNPSLATAMATELSYGYTASRLRLQAKLFISSTAHEVDVVRYYDDLAGEYSDAVVSGIGRLHYGIEASADVTWSQYFTSDFSLSISQCTYRTSPIVTTYADDDNTLIASSTAKMKGHNVGTPSVTLYGDVTFRHKGWMARASVQYWGVNYATPSYIRRTVRVVSYAASEEEKSALLKQQRLPDAATLDITLSKRFKFSNNTSLSIQLSARNILGSSVVYSAYEENRISRRTVGSRTDIAPFANRLTYAYPRLFSLSASLWF